MFKECKYSKRQARVSPLFQLLQDHWGDFTAEYGEYFEPQVGSLRTRIETVVGQFLECGLLDFGFARIRCEQCKLELFLPFSCKSRTFCPSCAAKRELFFEEFLLEEVLEPNISHRHVVFTIPKRLRGFFLRDRHLLADLSRLGYESLVEVMRQELELPTGRGAAVIVAQTFGSLLDFTPHAHALVAWGLFNAEGHYTGVMNVPPDVVEAVFRHKVFRFLLDLDLITEATVSNMLSWHHSGFSVFIGPSVHAFERDRLGQLARYMIRGPIALSRLVYEPGVGTPEDKDSKALERARGVPCEGKVSYHASKNHHKYGKNQRVWTPLLFLLDLIRHIPERHQKLVNYYGWYSNRTRGERKKRLEAEKGEGPCCTVVQKRLTLGHWRRFIKLIYEVDPLICPNCEVEMRVVSCLNDPDVIFKILAHTKLLGKDQKYRACGRAPPR